MEQIRFEERIWVKDFLFEEGQTGIDLREIISELQGSLFENLMKSKVIKKVRSKPAIYYLRIKLSQTCYRFFGPMKDNCIYLLHAFKKKSDKIPPRELELAIKRAEAFFG